MMHLAKIAAKYLDYAEIIELHHHLKADSPSGTALMTAKEMAEARGKPFVRPPEPVKKSSSRGEEVGGVVIHSVRLPGLMAHQEVILGQDGGDHAHPFPIHPHHEETGPLAHSSGTGTAPSIFSTASRGGPAATFPITGSEEMCKLMYEGLEEMVGQPLWKFVAEEEAARETIKSKLSGSISFSKNLERTYKRKDGTTLPVVIEDAPTRDAHGRITGIHATIRDITEHKTSGKRDG
jgi:PAS domain S-box-containing protein